MKDDTNDLIEKMLDRYADDPEKAGRFIGALKAAERGTVPAPSPAPALPPTKADMYKLPKAVFDEMLGSSRAKEAFDRCRVKIEKTEAMLAKVVKEKKPVRVKKREPVARAVELMRCIKSAVDAAYKGQAPDYLTFDNDRPVLFLGSFCANVGYDHLLVLWLLKSLRLYDQTFVREITMESTMRLERAYETDKDGKPVRRKDADHKIGKRVLIPNAKPVEVRIQHIYITLSARMVEMTADLVEAGVKKYSAELRDTCPTKWLRRFRKAHSLPVKWRMEHPRDFQLVWDESRPLFANRRNHAHASGNDIQQRLEKLGRGVIERRGAEAG